MNEVQVNREYKDRLFKFSFQDKADLLELYNAVNGTMDQPEAMELSLQDAFVGEKKGEACLDFKAIMLNINLGYNKELMEKCQRLKEYAQFISLVKKNIADGYDIKNAVSLTVDECIQQGIMADILAKNKAEVFEMILTEYNEQNHIANEKKISLDEGIEIGRKQGIRALIADNLEDGKDEPTILAKLMKQFELTQEQASAYLKHYQLSTGIKNR